jgi:sterol desaturase/sphingolipid hydroxylase (fatty acid hydroxylase superfamily)
MIESKDRVDQFRQEVADMKLRDPATSRDRLWLVIGIGLMILGLVLGLIAYPMSHGTTNPLEQRDALALGLGGVTAAVVGAALFVRYSIAAFLRFWLARLIYEQKAQTDRLLAGRDQPDA